MINYFCAKRKQNLTQLNNFQSFTAMFNFVRFYEEKIIIDKCLQAYVLSIMNKVLKCMLIPKYIYRNHKYLAGFY